jgi:hypothetical protein
MSKAAVKEVEPEVKQVAIARLVRDKAYQIRRKLDYATIKKYADVYKSGKAMPPVTVALVNGMLVLVDGWHRVAALERIGRTEVEANITPNTEGEALWLAAQANLEHGLTLKSYEIRLVFKAYMKAKKNITGKHRLKTYREIAEDIGKPHTTIRLWMIKDFPRIARKMGSTDEYGGRGEPQRVDASDYSEPAIQGLNRIIGSFKAWPMRRLGVV